MWSMFFIVFVLAVVGAFTTKGQGVQPYAIAAAVVALFTLGIASNFRNDPQSMPNYAALLSIAAGLASIAFIVVGATG